MCDRYVILHVCLQRDLLFVLDMCDCTSQADPYFTFHYYWISDHKAAAWLLDNHGFECAYMQAFFFYIDVGSGVDPAYFG